MDAREVVLMASGPSKAAAVAAAIEGPLTAMCPGSVLQLHRNASIYLDAAAATGLALTDYYTYVQAQQEDA